MTAGLPVTVIGGYLGAGKTTLINYALRHAAGTRLAVLVNEFGALPIDEDLIEAREDGLISIAGGCICCSFGDNLSGALMDLSRRKQVPDHILIEASGVAIPGSIAANVSLLPGFDLGASIVLADAETVQRQAGNEYVGDTILRQLADADVVLASKWDLASEAQQNDLLAWLYETAPEAVVIPSVQGAVPLEILTGPRTRAGRPEASAHSDRLFESRSFAPDGLMDVQSVVRRLTARRTGVVRAKGFLRDTDGTMRTVQIVGKRAQITDADPNANPGLVCIGFAGQLELADVFEGVAV